MPERGAEAVERQSDCDSSEQKHSSLEGTGDSKAHHLIHLVFHNELYGHNRLNKYKINSPFRLANKEVRGL